VGKENSIFFLREKNSKHFSETSYLIRETEGKKVPKPFNSGKSQLNKALFWDYVLYRSHKQVFVLNKTDFFIHFI